MIHPFAWVPPIIVQELFHRRPRDLQRLPRCELGVLGVTGTRIFSRQRGVVRARDTTMAARFPALKLP